MQFQGQKIRFFLHIKADSLGYIQVWTAYRMNPSKSQKIGKHFM